MNVRKLLTFILAVSLMLTAIPSPVFAETEVAAPDTSVEAVPEAVEDSAPDYLDIPALREENVKHFDLGDGTYQAVVYTHPVHYKDENGNWQDIDNSLTKVTNNLTAKYKTSDSRVSFSANYAADTALVTLSDNARSISMALQPNNWLYSGILSLRPGKVTNTSKPNTLEEAANADLSSAIRYNGVLPYVDLEYVVEYGYIKENIIVNKRQKDYTYTFSLALTGMYAQLLSDGSVGIYDSETDEVCYAIPAPFMYDSNGVCSEDVYYTLTETENGYLLTVTANREWIGAADRAFPVTIDPTIVGGTSNVADTYIDSDNPDTNFGYNSMLWIRSNRITFIKESPFSLPINAELISASLAAYYYYFDGIGGSGLTIRAYEVLKPWEETTLTWNDSRIYTNHGISTTYLDYANTYTDVGATVTSPQMITFNITDVAQGWLDGAENYGIALQYFSGHNLSVVLKSNETGSEFSPFYTYTYTYNPYAFFGIPDSNPDFDHNHISALEGVKELFTNNDFDTPKLYNSTIDPNQFKHCLNTSEIVVFRGHGEVTRSTDGNAIGTAVILSDLYDSNATEARFCSQESNYPNSNIAFIEETDSFSNLKLAMLICCDTAYGGLNAPNLPAQLVAHGANAVVGFSTVIDCEQAELFTEYFFEQFMQGASVEEAANYAMGRVNFVLMPTDSLYIFGDKNYTMYSEA